MYEHLFICHVTCLSVSSSPSLSLLRFSSSSTIFSIYQPACVWKKLERGQQNKNCRVTRKEDHITYSTFLDLKYICKINTTAIENEGRAYLTALRLLHSSCLWKSRSLPTKKTLKNTPCPSTWGLSSRFFEFHIDWEFVSIFRSLQHPLWGVSLCKVEGCSRGRVARCLWWR